MGTDQDEAGYQTQFNAAVSVIQNLPKHGAYQPSNDEKLKFYGYYKQATVGPCNISRPGFWDPIGRYKWDAWSKLGAMSQKDAMSAYITEMKRAAQKIIETIPLEDKSPEMFEPFRPLYEVIPDMPRPPDALLQTIIGNNDISEYKHLLATPEKREDLGDQHAGGTRQPAPITEMMEPGPPSGLEQRGDPLGGTRRQEQPELQRWESDNAYADSVEQLGSDKESDDDDSRIYPHLFQASDAPQKKAKTRSRRRSADRRKDSEPDPPSTNEASWRSPGEEDGGDPSGGLQSRCRSAPHNLSPQIKATVEALQASIQGLCQRLESLERALQEQRRYTEGQIQRPRKVPRRPLLAGSRTLLFIVVWPFVAHWLLRRFLRRKR